MIRINRNGPKSTIFLIVQLMRLVLVARHTVAAATPYGLPDPLAAPMYHASIPTTRPTSVPD